MPAISLIPFANWTAFQPNTVDSCDSGQIPLILCSRTSFEMLCKIVLGIVKKPSEP